MQTYREFSVILATKLTYFLAKIEKSGNIRVRVSSGVDYQSQFSPDLLQHNYTIPTRQE